jgi:pentatricopeptide repeat protein
LAFEPMRIQLCGRLAVELSGARVENLLPARQGRLLLAYLVANWDRAVPRDEVSFALWGDDVPTDADSSLNALVSKVRRVVGRSRIDGRGELRFVADDGTFVDMHAAIEALHRAESHARAGRWHQGWQPAHTAYQIARRELLVGQDAVWIDEWRRRLADVATRGLECHARCCLESGPAEAPNAERVARLLVERAPFRESGYALLMEALARDGNVAKALRVYDRLHRLLRDELGVAPGPEVSSVRDRLLGVAFPA